MQNYQIWQIQTTTVELFALPQLKVFETMSVMASLDILFWTDRK